MLDFIKDNWALLLVVTFIIFLVWSVMKASKRDDDNWEQEDEDDDRTIEGRDVIDLGHTHGGIEDIEILTKPHRN